MNRPTFKEKLRLGETVSLINVNHASATLVNIVGKTGVDAIMIDCEQGHYDFKDIEHMTYAARLNGMASIVRVPSAEAWTIERYVMRDIDGVIVPRLDTAAQAVKAVEDIRYASPGTFAQKAVIIQIESVSAVRELDAFLAVPNIDCFFVGAVDLAKSMGFDGDYSQQDVMAAMRAVLAEIRKQGKSAGFMVKESDVGSWREAGANMLYFHLNECFRLGMRDWKTAAGLA